jgi:alkylation response protein AidB-like acyl-CoA dehydrogenase
VAIFHDLPHEEEGRLLAAAAEWQQRKCDAGFGAITASPDYGGQGLPHIYERAFVAEEARYETPRTTELVGVTSGLIAPTIAAFGTPEQKSTLLRPLYRLETFACQLFSEPGAGSDLAALSCRAERDGDGWILNGQKVWTSGARYAAWGELIARTDATAPKHRGLTAFVVPLDTTGVEVRPIRQMTGGAAFNEVFLTDVRVPDALRLGEAGEGWKVALATLSFERAASARGVGRVGGSYGRLLSLARYLGVTGDPHIRQSLAHVYARSRLLGWVGQRATASARGGVPGPEASVSKLVWTQNLAAMSDVAALLLGPKLTADTGEWGTYCWTQHVVGAPGYRIAGGSDEIQRNLIAERVLGLPAGPRDVGRARRQD